MCKRAHKQTETNTVIAPFVDEPIWIIVVVEQDAFAHLGLLDSHQVVCSWVVVPPRGLEVVVVEQKTVKLAYDLHAHSLFSAWQPNHQFSLFFWECASAFLEALAVASMKHKR